MGGMAQILYQITSWTTQQSWGNDMNALNRFWVREGRIVKFCRNLWCLKLFASANKMENWESPWIKLDQRNCYGNWHNRLFDLLMEVCIRALSRCLIDHVQRDQRIASQCFVLFFSIPWEDNSFSLLLLPIYYQK